MSEPRDAIRALIAKWRQKSKDLVGFPTHGRGVTWAAAADELEAALHAEAPAPAPTWQPVSTAPKGRKVMLVRQDGVMQLDDWGLYCVYNGPRFVLWCDPPALDAGRTPEQDRASNQFDPGERRDPA